MLSTSSSAAEAAGRSAFAGEGAQLRRLATLADLLDSRWRIPVIGARIGIDGIASLLPVIGDSATALVSIYLVVEAARMGATGGLLTRMGWNVFIDWLVGSIPVVGTIFDIGFKANRRNVDLLRRHLSQKRR
jgi:hypothetical protein